MAVAASVTGGLYIYGYGVASKNTRKPVTSKQLVRTRIDQQDFYGKLNVFYAARTVGTSSR